MAAQTEGWCMVPGQRALWLGQPQAGWEELAWNQSQSELQLTFLKQGWLRQHLEQPSRHIEPTYEPRSWRHRPVINILTDSATIVAATKGLHSKYQPLLQHSSIATTVVVTVILTQHGDGHGDKQYGSRRANGCELLIDEWCFIRWTVKLLIPPAIVLRTE